LLELRSGEADSMRIKFTADPQRGSSTPFIKGGPFRIQRKPALPAEVATTFDPLAPPMKPSQDLIDMRYEAPQLD
jgi:hypothetical protein